MTAEDRTLPEAPAARAAVDPGTATGRRLPADAVADLVISVVLLATFGWAFLEANQWSDRASLFPHLVTGIAFVLTALHLLLLMARLRRRPEGRRGADPAARDASGHLPPGTVAVPHGAEDDIDEDDVEYVFQTAGRRRWAEALGWVAVFFVLLYVVGLYICAPVFSLLYLRFGGGRTWRLSVIYAVVTAVLLYSAFELALHIPTPPGLFLD